MCCFAWKYYGKSINCQPKPIENITCQNIIPSLYLKLFFWIFSLLGIIGNSFAIIAFLSNRKSSIFYKCSLAFGDVTISFYLLIVAISDVIYSGDKYLKNEEIWRYGKFCSFLGTMLTFSLNFSMVIVLLITIERYLKISNPFQSLFISKHQKLVIVTLVLIIGLLSLLPIIFFKVHSIKILNFLI